MKLANSWFTRRATQDTRTNIAQLPAIVASGPNIQSQPDKEGKEEQNGETYFEVGVTPVGGDEVVG